MDTKLTPVIRVVDEKCVNCHMCISVCPVKMCIDGSGDKVTINHDMCIGCGACIEACTHDARKGIDDSEDFWKALERKEKVIVIAAPALAAHFPENYLRLNGWLKSLGVQEFFDVAFGAELTVKSYLEYIKEEAPKTVIAQPCPALVTYLELYQPELLPYLAPADSPMVHTMKMVKEFFPHYKSCKIAVLSPCVAKRREFDAVGMGDFNVTIERILEKIKKDNIRLEDFPEVDFLNPPAERAVLFSSPGGLKATIEREVPHLSPRVRKIEGTEALYPYLKSLPDMIAQGWSPLVVDCLNCEKGCNGGTGTGAVHKPVDFLESAVDRRRKHQTERLRGRGLIPGNPAKIIQNSLKNFWKPGLYRRNYLPRNGMQNLKIPTKTEMEKIYFTMKKVKPDDFLNCASCGYNSCEEMAKAVHWGLNRPENCHHFQKSVIVGDRDKLRILSEKLQTQVVDAGVILAQVQGLIPVLNDKIREEYECLHQSTAAVEEVMANLRSSSQIASRQKAALEVLLVSIKNGETALVQSQQGISSAQKKVKEISGLVQAVNEVAAQTNLLSMNAAIEAAHAGTAGLGFAVVAGEIRTLAEKAGTSAGVISRSLKDLVGGMETAAGLSERTSHIIRGILGEMDQTGSNLAEIFQSMTEMGSGAGEITASLTKLNSSADGVKEAYKEMELSLGRLGKTISDLVVIARTE